MLCLQKERPGRQQILMQDLVKVLGREDMAGIEAGQGFWLNAVVSD